MNNKKQYRIVVIGTKADWFMYGFFIDNRPKDEIDLRKIVQKELNGRRWERATVVEAL